MRGGGQVGQGEAVIGPLLWVSAPLEGCLSMFIPPQVMES